MDVSKDKTLFTLLNRPLEVISGDTISDIFSNMSTKQVMANSGLHYDVPGISEKLLFKFNDQRY